MKLNEKNHHISNAHTDFMVYDLWVAKLSKNKKRPTTFPFFIVKPKLPQRKKSFKK